MHIYFEHFYGWLDCLATCYHVKRTINVYLSVVPFYFTLLSVINLSKTKPNHSYLFWGGYLIGVKNNKKPSPGRPKGAQGHLTGVAVKHFKP